MACNFLLERASELIPQFTYLQLNHNIASINLRSIMMFVSFRGETAEMESSIKKAGIRKLVFAISPKLIILSSLEERKTSKH